MLCIVSAKALYPPCFKHFREFKPSVKIKKSGGKEKLTLEGICDFIFVTLAYKDEMSQRSIILDKIGVEKGLPFLGPPPARPKPPSYDDVASSL